MADKTTLGRLMLLNQEKEIGTPTRPPVLQNLADYSMWKGRFESFIMYNDPHLMVPITFGYSQPQTVGLDGNPIPVQEGNLTQEQKDDFIREKKAFAAIAMGL